MWALTRPRGLPAINARLISWQYLAWVWSVYSNFPPLSDKGIYRQWAGATQPKGREAGKIEEVTLIAHRSELRAGWSHGYELDRAKPVGEMLQ